MVGLEQRIFLMRTLVCTVKSQLRGSSDETGCPHKELRLIGSAKLLFKVRELPRFAASRLHVRPVVTSGRFGEGCISLVQRFGLWKLASMIWTKAREP